MTKFSILALAVLLAAVAEASSGRGLLACNDQTEKRCKGKCIKFLTDMNNCGNCGVKCESTHVCRQGGCVCPKSRPQQCGKLGSCLNTITDPMHCGSCFNSCPSGQCKNSTCVGGCGITQKLCGGTCKNFWVDEANCGDCNVVCTGNTICRGGGCICPPTKPDICQAGVCTDKMTDVKHCGNCFNACKRGQTCVKGGCK